ncbi:LOW QUALITY PROTEIN: hypothetical protein V1478_018259, partial [Vespula squamosa]
GCGTGILTGTGICFSTAVVHKLSPRRAYPLVPSLRMEPSSPRYTAEDPPPPPSPPPPPPPPRSP